VTAVVQDAAAGDEARREWYGVHEVHAEVYRDDFFVQREAGGAAGRIGERHEHAAVYDAVEVRMLGFDRQLELYLATAYWHVFCVYVFEEGILVIKFYDVLLQFRQIIFLIHSSASM